MIDLEMEDVSDLDEIAGRSFPGKVTGHSILFSRDLPRLYGMRILKG